MNRGLLVIFLLLTLPLSAQQWYFWMDEYQPAERPWLQSSQQILWLNNTLPQPADFGHSIVVDGEVISNAQVALNNAALHCLFTATQVMDESMEFARVELQEQSQNTSTNYYARQSLSNLQMRDLCLQYETEALVVLNQLVLYDIVESFPTNEGYYAYLQAYAQSNWTVYNASKNRSTSFTYADTLLWESDIQYVRSDALKQLPNRTDALLYLAREVGTMVSESLTPQWVPTKRYLYDHKDETLQTGINAFRLQRWNEAIQVWQTAISHTDKKTAAFAAANIAIAFEMQGDYASACDYAQRAIRLFGAWKTAYGRQQQVNIRYYLGLLQEKRARQGDQ